MHWKSRLAKTEKYCIFITREANPVVHKGVKLLTLGVQPIDIFLLKWLEKCINNLLLEIFVYTTEQTGGFN